MAADTPTETISADLLAATRTVAALLREHYMLPNTWPPVQAFLALLAQHDAATRGVLTSVAPATLEEATPEPPDTPEPPEPIIPTEDPPAAQEET